MSKQIREIEMNPENLNVLRVHHSKAVIAKKEYFDCLDTEFNTKYAAFLLSFYADKLRQTGKTSSSKTDKAEVENTTAKTPIKKVKNESRKTKPAASGRNTGSRKSSKRS